MFVSKNSYLWQNSSLWNGDPLEMLEQNHRSHFDAICGRQRDRFIGDLLQVDRFRATEKAVCRHQDFATENFDVSFKKKKLKSLIIAEKTMIF